ncbi:predicted protein, partial [Arabidopsis lyrata subsp. lyrata]
CSSRKQESEYNKAISPKCCKKGKTSMYTTNQSQNSQRQNDKAKIVPLTDVGSGYRAIGYTRNTSFSGFFKSFG